MSDRPTRPPVATAWAFGAKPLAQTEAAAHALRRLAEVLLSLENEHPEVDELVEHLTSVTAGLERFLPEDPSPRVGPERTPWQRLYLDHAYDVGSFNPIFPEYRFEQADERHASGSVEFPVVFEGPPGLVHGGVLGQFFDSVIAHHNCLQNLAGKTRTLRLRYRRPVPLLTPLRFTVAREVVDRSVLSLGRLYLDDEELCSAEMDAVAMTPDLLAARGYGVRGEGGHVERPAAGTESARSR